MVDARPDTDLMPCDSSTTIAAVLQSPAHFINKLRLRQRPDALDSRPDLVFLPGVENAWKFTQKTVNPKIEFGSFPLDGDTVYYVRDNGAGFDPAFLLRILFL